METLDSRRLFSATGWQAEPVALPHYFNHTPTEITTTATKGHGQKSAAASSVREAYAGSATAYGLTPAQVEGAYGITGISFNGAAGTGAGETIAIVDAYDDPYALSDLNAFSTHFNLPIFDSGSGSPTFTKISQTGSTTSLPGTDPAGPYASTGGSDWEEEESLDIEWAHAIAPAANIDLIEATNSSSLFTAVSEARSLSGVTVVSMSWGGSEFSGETGYDSTYFTTPSGHIGAGGIAGGITFVASSGDQGAYGGGNGAVGVEYPAASPNVLAVGGTTLNVSGSTYSSETAWGNGTSSYSSGGGGGGISTQEAQPSYQTGVVTQSTTKRTVPDVSMEANPNTGVPVYDSWDFGTSTPWIPGYEGGTSLAAPMWAGLVAIADQGRNLSGLGSLNGSTTQTLPTGRINCPSSDFHDITSGSNGYSAGTGYDLVTGIGSPVANSLVPGLAGVSSGGTTGSNPTTSPPTISLLSASSSTITSGNTFTLTASGVTDPNSGGSISKVAFYRESNSTTGLQTTGTADTLIGTATSATNGSWIDSVSTTGLAAGTYKFYAVATDNSGLTSNVASTTVTVTAPATGNSATYVRTDSTTLGNWKGVYGTQAEYVAGDSLTDPSYATLTTNGSVYEWASNSSSSQYVQRSSSGKNRQHVIRSRNSSNWHQSHRRQNAPDSVLHRRSNGVSGPVRRRRCLRRHHRQTAQQPDRECRHRRQIRRLHVTGNVTFKFTPTGGSYGNVRSDSCPSAFEISRRFQRNQPARGDDHHPFGPGFLQEQSDCFGAEEGRVDECADAERADF